MADAVEGSLLKFKVELTFTLYGYPQKGNLDTKGLSRREKKKVIMAAGEDMFIKKRMMK